MTTSSIAPGSDLDVDTRVVGHDGVWTGSVASRWNVGSNPNGGYTMALGARAMLEASGRPDPLSLTAHYIRPPAAGPVTVVPEVVRSGRRYATVSASVAQGEREALRLLGAFGDLSAQEGPTRLGATAPQLPDPDLCPRMLEGPEPSLVPEVMQRYDLRLDPDCQWVRARREPFDASAPASAGPLEVTGWIRFADGAEPSVLGLLAMVDAFPPTIVGSTDVGWVPTVELTVHVRGRPAPGWVRGVFRTGWLRDGLLEQDGELWDSAGSLVAMARQLAIALPRR